jgi:hypothetical protein
MDPSGTNRIPLDLRLFLDPDAILAVAGWGALIAKWILRGLETNQVAGASPDLPSRLVGAKCSLHAVDMRRLSTWTDEWTDKCPPDAGAQCRRSWAPDTRSQLPDNCNLIPISRLLGRYPTHHNARTTAVMVVVKGGVVPS